MSTGHDGQRPQRAGQPAAQRVRVGRGTPASRQAARSQNSERTAKNARNQTPLHFTAHAQPNSTPPAIRQPRGPSRNRCGRPLGRRADPRAHPVAVDHQAGDRGEDEDLQEDVEQADPGEGEGEAVQGQQQPGDQPEQRRAGQPPGQPDEDDDGDGAGHRRREPPAEGVVAEELLAGRDQPLAQRRVDDERVAAVVLETPGQQLARLGRVVRLVEEQVLRVADAPQPAGEGGHARAPRSAPRTAGGRRAAAGCCPGGGRGAAGGGRRRGGAPVPSPPARGPAPPCRPG